MVYITDKNINHKHIYIFHEIITSENPTNKFIITKNKNKYIQTRPNSAKNHTFQDCENLNKSTYTTHVCVKTTFKPQIVCNIKS